VIRRRTAALVALAVCAVVPAGSPSVARGASGAPTVFTISTVPRVPGVHFTFRGITRSTGTDGTTSFSASGPQVAQLRNPYGLSRAVRLKPVARRDGSVFRLERWYSKSIHGERTLVAALREFVPTHIGFRNPNAGRFEARHVDRVVTKRSDGAVFSFSGKRLEKPVMLQATRVVPLSGGLVSKNLLYRVQAVTIEGNNLVNRSQQAFSPAEGSDVTLQLLFYSAKFLARDRLFQFPIGSGIRLEFPNGRVHFYPFDDNGEVNLPALPRGNYRVTVKAPGLKMTSPVAMTRDQVATLKVVSYLDVGVIFVVLLAIAGGLLLVGRPALRRRLRRSLQRGSRKIVQA
jgi:hypothetical protein